MNQSDIVTYSIAKHHEYSQPKRRSKTMICTFHSALRIYLFMLMTVEMNIELFRIVQIRMTRRTGEVSIRSVIRIATNAE